MPVRPRPFDVARLAVERLDAPAQFGQLAQMRRIETRLILLLGRDIAPTFRCHLDHFGGDVLLDHPAGFAVEMIAIGRDQAGDDAFAQPPRRLDEHALPFRVERVAREQHAGRFRRHQPLHDDGHRQSFVADALMPAIRDGSFALQRLPAAADGGAHLVLAAHAEDRFLLAGETGDGPVLRRGRRAHGDRSATQLSISVGDLLYQGRIAGERLDAQSAIGGGGDAETRRHRQAGTGHPSQAQGLAADGLRVAGLDLLEGEQVAHADSGVAKD